MSAAVSFDSKHHLTVLTNSELRTDRACARRHHYQYRLLRRPRTSSAALGFGTLWHLGMEHWWKAPAGSTSGERLVKAVEAIQAANHPDPFGLVMAEELLVAYTVMWEKQEFETICVEQTFRIPLINPESNHASRTYEIGGKFDGIVRIGGRLLVLEHKTTASDIDAGSLYWKKVQTLDTQVSLYMRGAKESGYPVEACLYDVVRKPALRPLKATPLEARKFTKQGFLYANQRETDETPEEYRLRLREDIGDRPERYLARGEVVRLEADEKDHAYDTWQQARMLRERELAGFAPKNPDSCSAFGGCPYLPVCSGEATIDDDTLYRTAEAAHEELETTE